MWAARPESESGKADKNGRVEGFLAGRIVGERIEIDGVAVDRACQRRGVGRELVRVAMASARARGLHLAVLHVSVKNRAAIALYEAEHFTVRRFLKDFYPPTAFGPERDAFEMVRLL